MEADSPPEQSTVVVEPTIDTAENVEKKLYVESCEEHEADTTIHGFNASNITVIERLEAEIKNQVEVDERKPFCEGSDSGVEVIETVEYKRTLSASSQDFETLNCARSCDSSVISYCSNYDEAYNILVRRNSTLLEDYTLRNGDVTSENGSESSSISGSQKPRCNRRSTVNSSKKNTSVADVKTKGFAAKERSRSKPPITPSRNSTVSSARLKSIDRVQGKHQPSVKTPAQSTKLKPAPNKLDLTKREPSTNITRTSSTRIPAASVNRTPQGTPTDDGRWPSIYSRPTPLIMSKSLKGSLEQKQKLTPMENKTIEKYATLPRRKKEKSADNISDQKKPSNSSRDNSIHRLAVTKKSSRETTPSKMFTSLYIPKSKHKTKIYHEFSTQTALTLSDVEKALSGTKIAPKEPTDSEKYTKEVQVNFRAKDVEKLKEQLKQINEQYETLRSEHKTQTNKLKETEEELKAEQVEKQGLRDELMNNNQRVISILGGEQTDCDDANTSSDSLMVLETRFQNVGQVVIQQEEEIARLNNFCRSYQVDLEKSLAAQKTLLQHQQELEVESVELQEFMQAEKTTLTDALNDVENEIRNHKLIIAQKDKELAEKQDVCINLARISEQRRQENGVLKTRLKTLEAKSRELLVHQGSSVSGASVALSSLVERLGGLVEELVVAYSISEQELEDVIYHNEAYNNSSSSPESTPEKSRNFTDESPSPKGKGSSFVSAVINAIKNAAAQSPFTSGNKDPSKDNVCSEDSSSNEMLDSETEPCLMMEHVLEDVVIPDGHSHNMISSGHGSMLSSRLTHSESLKDLSHAILLNRQMSEQTSLSYTGSLSTSATSDILSINDLFPSISIVDQVIDVDNMITRLLKVIRIIQLENDACMNELQDQRDSLAEQVDKQKETNKVVVKQLKDWENLGARLKTEVKELMSQLSRKNAEMDSIKSELNQQREQVEKLNQDVCELSTALAKAELEKKIKEEEVGEQIKKWEHSGEVPASDVLGPLVVIQNEVPSLKERLAEKEKRLNELAQEFLASKQVLTESLKDAVKEAKRQYDAIDNALEVLHNIQPVVQQCPPLSSLQRELEEVSFQSASSMPIVTPPDCNANAALLQAMANLEISHTINTTA